MLKKITIGDPTNPDNRYVVIADKDDNARFVNYGLPVAVGDMNLICEEKLEMTVKDGKDTIGKMLAYIWYLPTIKILPESAERLAASPRQQVINYLIKKTCEQRAIERSQLQYDNTKMVGTITCHLHIVELYVAPAYRQRGIATNMLDFAQALSEARTISFLSTPQEMNNTVSGFAMYSLGFVGEATLESDMASKKKTLYVHYQGKHVYGNDSWKRAERLGKKKRAKNLKKAKKGLTDDGKRI